MRTGILVIDEFIYELYFVKNYSPVTIYDYTRDIRLFLNFLIEFWNLEIEVKNINVFLLSKVEESTIFAFFVYLNYYKNDGPKTRNRVLSSIKTFYKWLYVKYYSVLEGKKNPVSDIPNIEKIERLPKYIALDKAKSLESIFNNSNSKYPTRNNTIMILFLNCGLRLSELIGINLKDINFNEKTIRIMGKRNKERTIYLNKACVNAINLYLEVRTKTEIKECSKDALFLNEKGERLKETGVKNVCKKAFELANLSEYGYTVHTLRHTAGTYLYKSTKDILIVKNFLGHESITSTEIYTHLFNDELKRATDSNPLNNL